MHCSELNLLSHLEWCTNVHCAQIYIPSSPPPPLLSLHHPMLQAYPEFKSNDLYLSGESYAGKYVPMLAREVYNEKDASRKLNLKGFAVGDGVSN